MSAALAVVAALTLAAGARADIVATLPPGSYFTDVSVASAGAVWVASSGPTRGRSAIGTVVPGGVSWTSMPIAGAPLGGTSENAVFARPDGGVWGFFGGRVSVRSSPTGFARTNVFPRGDYESTAGASADGSALVVPEGQEGFVRLGLDGSRTTVHYSARKPSGQSNCAIDRIAAAPDNTLVVDDDCHRLVRVRLDGSVVETIPLTGALEEWADFPRVVAGASGDLWIGGDSSLAHRVGGVATKVALPADRRVPRAVGRRAGRLAVDRREPGLRPDAHHRGRRAAGAGADHRGGDGRRPGRDGVAHQPQPARPRRARGERGSCDQRQPTVRLPDVENGTVTLAALRRRHGLRVTSSEPGSMIGAVTVAGVDVKPQQAVDRRGTTLRFSPKLLRRIARSGRIEVRYLQVWDANGNGGGPTAAYVRVRRR